MINRTTGFPDWQAGQEYGLLANGALAEQTRSGKDTRKMI